MAATGFTAIAAGSGNPIIPGVGRPSIMGAGNCTHAAGGCGRPTPFGHPRGWSGVSQEIIAAGRPCRLMRSFKPEPAGSSMACTSA